jgi:hypothetical protein
MVRIRLVTSLLVLVAACGGGNADVTSTAGETTSSTTAAPTTSSTAAVTTSSAVTSTTASTTTTTVVEQWPATPLLPDGRPATFLAVTDDYHAVEVDTETGAIIHDFGNTGTAADLATAEEMPPNVLVGAWRSLHGEVIGLSDCCEPAAGRLFFLGAGVTLGDEPYTSTDEWYAGWTLSPTLNNTGFVSLGYSLEIGVPAGPVTSVWIDEPSLGFPSGAAAWARDSSALFWTTQLEAVTMLVSLDLLVELPNPVTVLEWVGVSQYLDGIGSQESGNLVGFLHTRNEDYEIVETEGVVFSTSGELLTTFPVETGSSWGGYDASGRFLIYVDGEGEVRWQGLGQSGSLGEGFYFASW